MPAPTTLPAPAISTTVSTILVTLALITILICGYYASPVSVRRERKARGKTVNPVFEGSSNASEPEGEGDIPLDSPNNRIPTIAVFVLALCALFASVADAFLADEITASAVAACGWFFISVQAIFLLCARSESRRFDVGKCVALSAVAQSVVLTLDIFVAFIKNDALSKPIHPALVLGVIQLLFAWGVFIAAFNIVPKVTEYHNGKPVDGQLACPAWQRYTFYWIKPLLDQTRSQRRIEASDLPALDRVTRSEGLNARFAEAWSKIGSESRVSLWKVLLRTHYKTFVHQWILCSVEGVIAIFPSFCLFRILTLMEAHANDPGQQGSSPASIWIWIVLLAGSKVVHVFIENWLWWVSFALLAIPAKAELSAAIFDKALRVKAAISDADLHKEKGDAAEKTSTTSDQTQQPEDSHESDPLLSPAASDAAQADPTPEGQELSDQDGVVRGIVNFLGIDVWRISDFCAWNMDLLRGVVKILVGAAFLVFLIGWWSTLAGLAVPLLLQPFNMWVTNYYHEQQVLVMKARDKKSQVVQEALQGIRQIKFSATEGEWETRIFKDRERELRVMRGMYVAGVFLTFTWMAMPALIGAAALSVYALVNQRMLASVAFSALTVFSSLEWVLSALPVTITEMLDAKVSVKRLDDYFATDERPPTSNIGETVTLRNATVAWPAESRSPEEFTLRDVDLQFPPSRLSVIHGRTGTGKSLLLNAIIGEADVLAGQVHLPARSPHVSSINGPIQAAEWIIPSAVAYVSQIPWIENASVKAAILFGLPYDRERFAQVISACALLDDLKMLPDGQDTEIGATGINLSGGQRWRLTLARALYSRAGVLVMDDIFSAVDSHVGSHLLEHAILGPLGRGRTRILVTHHVGLVERHASYIIRLAAGRVDDILQKTVEDEEDQHVATKATRADIEAQAAAVDELRKPRKFVQDEFRAEGRVSWRVYKTYMTASGGFSLWALSALLFTAAAFAGVGRSFWLSLWTESYTLDTMLVHMAISSHEHELTPAKSTGFYLGIYLAISLVAIGLTALKMVFIIVAALRAARRLFVTVTRNVLHAPLRWLDSEPTGRILNRFVGDFERVDSRVGQNIVFCANGLFSLVFIIVSSLYVSPWTAIPIFALLVMNVYVVSLYIDTARDIKRLETVATSPIHELVGSTVSGLTTIRSYAKSQDYLKHMFVRLDNSAQAAWYVRLAMQWLSCRLGLLGIFFTASVAVVVGALPAIDASLAGFALSLALDFSTDAEGTITRYSDMELDMNSTERVVEYTDMKTESRDGAEPSPIWPSEGAIVVRDLEVGYADDLPSVLKGISFSVPPGARIGIVGRTGSGKSSLTLALFRFLEARCGSILIDGEDISAINLHALRRRIAVIPQDPVLFSGTLRSNLDPGNNHTDEALLSALERVNFFNKFAPTTENPSVSTTPSPSNHYTRRSQLLSAPIARGGANLSQGEKQLLCLARAILSQPRILVLDEATSAVDMHTDKLIQQSIRNQFRHSTILCVAHRLSSVADFDRILVLADGQIAEYDRPEVLAKTKGKFWAMLKESGERDALRHLLDAEDG